VDNAPLDALLLGAEERQDGMGRTTFSQRMRTERGRALHDALTRHRGDVRKAAKELHITPQYVYLLLRTEFPAGALAGYRKPKA